MMAVPQLKGERFVLRRESDEEYPRALMLCPRPPQAIYGIGDPRVLQKPGLAVIGARKATPYGRSCAYRFSWLAAKKGVTIVSGGARGCDSEAHRAALDVNEPTVVVLGGGCDKLYPAEHFGMFQQVVDSGGAVISERPWDVQPRGYMFRERNRIIAGLAAAVLIVEAGLPSGTFSTADEALEAGRDVLVVPGAITSATSAGANRLLRQGAIPVVDDESFEDELFKLFGVLKRPLVAASNSSKEQEQTPQSEVIAAILANPSTSEDLYGIACKVFPQETAYASLMECLVVAEAAGVIARQADGKWGPCVARS